VRNRRFFGSTVSSLFIASQTIELFILCAILPILVFCTFGSSNHYISGEFGCCESARKVALVTCEQRCVS
jgi:hypothetical protein